MSSAEVAEQYLGTGVPVIVNGNALATVEVYDSVTGLIVYKSGNNSVTNHIDKVSLVPMEQPPLADPPKPKGRPKAVTA